MIPRDVLEKIRRIEITTNRLVTDTFAGQYHSVFKGRGVEFDEVREYQPGDDIRSIDWNVTARTGTAYVKKYIEERELTVMILVDVSASCRFATVKQLKSSLAAELSAVLAFSAIRNNDKIGLLMFTDRVETYIPPRKGRLHVLRMIREVLCFDPAGVKTDMPFALDFLNRVLTRRAVCFIISDFSAGSGDRVFSLQKLSRSLAVTRKRHDLIAVVLTDPLESSIPSCGLVSMEDPETRDTVLVDTFSSAVREAYKLAALDRLAQRDTLLRSRGVDQIVISTAEDYAEKLVAFFAGRRRRCH